MNKFSVYVGIPEFTKGLVRELRVRWMHQEMGIPYEEVRYPHAESKKDKYREKQPFGQVPYFESGDLCMFETGAILLHLALKHEKLIPREELARAQVFTWLFAALNSVEPYVFHNFLLSNDQEAPASTKAKALAIVDDKLSVVSKSLEEKVCFAENFSIADIVMTTVLKTCEMQGLLENYPNLRTYVERNEARPAFQRALSEHVKLYEAGAR